MVLGPGLLTDINHKDFHGLWDIFSPEIFMTCKPKPY